MLTGADAIKQMSETKAELIGQDPTTQETSDMSHGSRHVIGNAGIIWMS